MNGSRARLRCMGPPYALKRDAGSIRSLPPDGAHAFPGMSRQERAAW